MYQPPLFPFLMNSARPTILQNTGRIAPEPGWGRIGHQNEAAGAAAAAVVAGE
jgi:hypothetical protein